MPGRSIKWSTQANQDLEDLIEFLLVAWDGEVATRFLDDLEHVIDSIAKQPGRGAHFEQLPGTRKVLASGVNLLIYSYNETELFIIRLVDGRMNLQHL
jgi:plasmid stabilization system protein ParE